MRTATSVTLLASVMAALSLGCARDDSPTGVVAHSPLFSTVRTPQSFTVGPLVLNGIDFQFPGPNLHFRDALLVGAVTGDLVGTATIALNADLDGSGNGPTWGTVTIATSGGEWQGSLTGHFQGDLPAGILLSSQVTLHGPGQQLLKAECDEIPPSNSETLACTGASADPGQ